MFLLLLLACGDGPAEAPDPKPTADAPASIGPSDTPGAEAPSDPAPPERAPALPVALYVAAGGAAAPLAGVPAVAPGGSAEAVEGAETTRWPSEGVEATTLSGQALRFTGNATVPCPTNDDIVGGIGLEEAAIDGALIVAPAAWAASWEAPEPAAAEEALRQEVLARPGTQPASVVQVALNQDLDGDGVAERLVLAHAPSVDAEKPGVTTALWGAELAPLEGFDFNGALRFSGWMPTPAGPILVLQSQWMGGTGAHAWGLQDGAPQRLGEWVCGS